MIISSGLSILSKVLAVVTFSEPLLSKPWDWLMLQWGFLLLCVAVLWYLYMSPPMPL